MTTHQIAYIGLGSNLSNPREQITRAIEAIDNIPESKVSKVSSQYLSKPMGPQNQDDYINAVLALKTYLSPLVLLDALQSIENEAGRVRKDNRWGARVLDCDILLFGNQMINNARLTIPHYGLKHREFVLLPLAEISQNLYLPDNSSINDLAQNINCNDIVKL
jgi:2-amino-4-hydroxy-6-hydroxymethyldihydropteridine diphosphokinase